MQIFVRIGRESAHGTVTAQVDPLQTLARLKSALICGKGAPNNFYFSFDGRPLEDSLRFVDYGIQACNTLHVRVRACGGGGDGGATGAESRDCYLNMYAEKKPDKVDPNEARLAKWSQCMLSSEPLTQPCAIDLLGNLFNKEALVSSLLTKSLPRELRHIRGLKDIVSIHLSPLPRFTPDDELSDMKFRCPVSGLEFNGKYKFFALRTCGHVFSARAFREVQSSSCLVCHKEFAESDKIVINGNEEEVQELRQRIEEDRKAKDKKEKKVKNGSSEKTTVCAEVVKINKLEKVSGSRIKRKEDESLLTKDPKNAAILLDKSALHTLKKYKAVDHVPPNATKDVYASIFTSSSKTKFKETFSCRSLPLGRN